MLTQQDMPGKVHSIKDLQNFCITPYDATFKGVHILFPKNVRDTLGEYLRANGKRQLHTAETEKYAHVTFFFNGGRENSVPKRQGPYPGAITEVARYDLKPEMSAYEVKDKLVVPSTLRSMTSSW